jgi:enamine deaminase RidA (YjgF/YER057c/UK114 family)
MPQEAKFEYLQPEGLVKTPAFTHAIAVSGDVKTIYIGGQNGVDETGAIVGSDLVTQIFRNLRSALAAGGAELEHIIKWNILVLEGPDPREGFAVFQEEWQAGHPPPVITAAFVRGLAVPGALVEIEAIAVVPLS